MCGICVESFDGASVPLLQLRTTDRGRLISPTAGWPIGVLHNMSMEWIYSIYSIHSVERCFACCFFCVCHIHSMCVCGKTVRCILRSSWLQIVYEPRGVRFRVYVFGWIRWWYFGEIMVRRDRCLWCITPEGELAGFCCETEGWDFYESCDSSIANL